MGPGFTPGVQASNAWWCAEAATQRAPRPRNKTVSSSSKRYTFTAKGPLPRLCSPLLLSLFCFNIFCGLWLLTKHGSIFCNIPSVTISLIAANPLVFPIRYFTKDSLRVEPQQLSLSSLHTHSLPCYPARLAFCWPGRRRARRMSSSSSSQIPFPVRYTTPLHNSKLRIPN